MSPEKSFGVVNSKFENMLVSHSQLICYGFRYFCGEFNMLF